MLLDQENLSSPKPNNSNNNKKKEYEIKIEIIINDIFNN